MQASELILQIENYLAARTGLQDLSEVSRFQRRAFQFDFDVEQSDLWAACDLLCAEIRGRPPVGMLLLADEQFPQKIGRLILAAASDGSAEETVTRRRWKEDDERRLRLVRAFNLFAAGLAVSYHRRLHALESRDAICRWGLVLMRPKNLVVFLDQWRKIGHGKDAEALIGELVRRVAEQPAPVDHLDLLELFEAVTEKAAAND